MTFPWQPMLPEDFASFVALLGPKIVRKDDIYWSEIRTFFYRPLLPLSEQHPDAVNPPFLARFGGAQYPVPPAAEANSHLNWLLFDQTKDYSTARLDKTRRRQVRLAAREFVIRPMTDVGEFKQQAYPVYLSFYERTRYKVGAGRRDQAFFGRWADDLFAIPRVLILGAYRQGILGGISLSYQVKDTIFYATFFCHNEALDLYLSDLMLHTVRASAAVVPEVRQVFVGMYKGNRGLDDFYLMRGAKLVRQRARLDLNPVARLLLQKFLPAQYEQLLGHLPAPPTTVTGSEFLPPGPTGPGQTPPPRAP